MPAAVERPIQADHLLNSTMLWRTMRFSTLSLHYLPACTLSTPKSFPTAWHTSQLSPNLGSVLAWACAMAEDSWWQAVQADVVAGAGTSLPWRSWTGFLPIGKTPSVPLTWHMSHFAVSPTPPEGVIVG